VKFEWPQCTGQHAVDANPLQEIHDRALKDMMNGELRSKGAKDMVWVLEKPQWMKQNPSEWSDEQKQLAAAFQAEQNRINEARESRYQTVEAEVCNLQQKCSYPTTNSVHV
jgi:hypothetical protein